MKQRATESISSIIRFYETYSALRMTFRHAMCKVTPPSASEWRLHYFRSEITRCETASVIPVEDLAFNLPVVAASWEALSDFVSAQDGRLEWYTPYFSCLPIQSNRLKSQRLIKIIVLRFLKAIFHFSKFLNENNNKEKSRHISIKKKPLGDRAVILNHYCEKY